jgi:formylglycine-generating enzyme required for sulfatase activity
VRIRGSTRGMSIKCLVVLIASLCAISCARYDPLLESGSSDSGSSVEEDGGGFTDEGDDSPCLECDDDCKPNVGAICTGDVTYWMDSCGHTLEVKDLCACGCNVDSTACQDPCECVPDCTGKKCGFDGCEGACPPGCGEDEICVSGACELASPEIEWIEIPGGRFMMGSDDPEADDSEKPMHWVTVHTFEMARTETTLVQYRACVDDGVCTEPDDRWNSYYCNWLFNGRESDPVNCVDFRQAVAFCTWASGRLPTEAEWEYAARSGGRNVNYPWGDDSPTECVHAHYDWCKLRTTPVCSHPVGDTGQGLCDMAGNVWEWAQDWYHRDYDGAPVDGRAWEHPVGVQRVIRGASWWTGDPFYMRSTSRLGAVPGWRSFDRGFRCARDVYP